MGKHTPRPWKVVPTGEVSAHGPTVTIDASPLKIVARPDWHGSHAEYMANAHLMAAAPELLAACKAAIAYDIAIQKRAASGEVDLIATGGAVAMGDDLDSLYNDWMTKSRDAVAAAESQLAATTP